MNHEIETALRKNLDAARADTERERSRAIRAECEAARLREYLEAAERRDTTAVQALLNTRRELGEVQSLAGAAFRLIKALRQELAEAKK